MKSQLRLGFVPSAHFAAAGAPGPFALQSRRAPWALALGLGLAWSLTATAAPATPLAAPPEGRVIVTLRAGAPLLRAQPAGRELAQSRSQTQATFEARAQALGARLGSSANKLGNNGAITVRSGRALTERSQVLHASGISSTELVRRLLADPNVESAVPDLRRRALALPNDPLYGVGPAVNLALQTGGPSVGQWYLRAPTEVFKSATNVEAAWDRGFGASSLVVAVLDTGVRSDHLDLAGQVLPGRDFIADTATANDGGGRDSDASDPGDYITEAEANTVGGPNYGGAPSHCSSLNPATGRYAAVSSSWHGTHVAALVGAATNNGQGMAGVAPGARILPVRVLGKCGGYDSDIAAGMLWAAGIDQPGQAGSSTPARVLNLSLGGEGACSSVYRDAVAQVNARGAVVVAAAGNSVGHAVGTPANCPGVIAVTGLRHAGSKVGFSDLGPEIAIGAPGGNCINITAGSACLYPLLTASNSGTTVPLAGGSIYTDSFNASVGTSFATPIVAGTVALMLSAQPGLLPAEIKQALQASARPFPSTGADNGPDDPTPVAQCRAPDASEQLQCYCTTALCGAGMLDAAGAVSAAADGLFARISTSPAAPVVGVSLTLSAAPSLVAAGRSAVAWEWVLLSGGGVVGGFVGATNGATAQLTPLAAGSVLLRLTVTDDRGQRSSTEQTLAVTAAPVVAPVTPPSTAPGADSGGGGSMSAWALALLACASLILILRQRALTFATRRASPLPR